MKKVFALIILIAGIALIGTSIYIKSQVAEGRGQIADAQRKVDQGNSLFSVTPQTKELGKAVTGSAQSQINEGREQVSYYATLANRLQVGGMILLALGVIFLLLRKRR